MDEKKLQKRYAQSLFDLARQNDIVSVIHNDITLIYDVCKQSHELNVILTNPTIKPLKKKEILFALFGQSCNELTMKFLSLITVKRREIYLKEICDSWVDIYNEYNNIKIAKISCVQELSEEVKHSLQNRLEKEFDCKVKLETKQDKELIGGLVIEIDGKQFDASYRRKLNDLRKEIIK